ncbi:MAG: hypothetical protein KA258_05025 [Deltaproteobacteria bacterium]|nr:hypothetical protein [Deltaproteobacteria bacterium]
MNRPTLSRGLLALLVILPTLSHAQQDSPPAGYPQYNGYPQPGYQPQQGYQPPQQGYPQQGYPQQGYPQPGYQPPPGSQPPPQQYPNQQYPGAQPYPNQPYPNQPYPNQPYPNQPYPGYQPPPSAQPGQQPYGYPAPYPNQPGASPYPASPQSPTAEPSKPPADAKLTLTSPSEEAKAALSSCLDAMDNFRYELVRLRCGEAIEKDDKLALAHALLAQLSNLPLVQKRHITAAKEITRQVSEGERLFTEGLLALAEDQRQVARAAFEALVGQLPGDKHAHHYRGLIRYRFGDLDGAQADFRRALELDAKFGPAHNALGHLSLRKDNVDEAAKAFAKYVELAPKEANAHDSLAMLHLRKGDLGFAVESAHKAIELDPKFLRGNLRLGDALLLQGNLLQARKAYATVMASPDPSEHHEAALRLMRSRLYEGLGVPNQKSLTDAEKDLQSELEWTKRLHRRADQVQTLTEIARLQLERSAVVDAAKTLVAVRELLDSTESAASPEKTEGKTEGKPEVKADAAKPVDKSLADKAAPTLTEDDKVRYRAELLWLRALLLHAVGERELAAGLANEIEKTVRGKLGQRMAEDLRGDLAARSSNRQLVVKHLSQSTRATSRLALALALGGGKPGEQLDMPKARTLMEELSRRNTIDTEGALTRGRAKQWLKQNPPDKT